MLLRCHFSLFLKRCKVATDSFVPTSGDCRAERNYKEDADNLVFRARKVRHRQASEEAMEGAAFKLSDR